jgi:hypothetical protein
MENVIGIFNMSLGGEVGGWDISFVFSTWAPAWRSRSMGPRWAFSAHAFLVAPRHSSTDRTHNKMRTILSCILRNAMRPTEADKVFGGEGGNSLGSRWPHLRFHFDFHWLYVECNSISPSNSLCFHLDFTFEATSISLPLPRSRCTFGEVLYTISDPSTPFRTPNYAVTV